MLCLCNTKNPGQCQAQQLVSYISLIFFSGPLTALINGKVTLVGLVTGGEFNCSVPGRANYFARVTAKRDWILQNSDAGEWQNGKA